jgi:hypothetical protein
MIILVVVARFGASRLDRVSGEAALVGLTDERR